MGALKGQTAIVTGAAAGLGYHYAKALAAQGCDLVICDIDPKIEDASRTLAETGVRVIPHIADVGLASDVARVVDSAMRIFGRIDVLINNAGICRLSFATDSLDKSLDDYDALIGTNLRGPFMFGRAVIPHMIAQGSGNIINIATDHVHTFPGRPTNGFGMMDHYDTSKWGLIGLTLTWAKALRPHNIRVNAFCMDATDSPMLRHFSGPDVSDSDKARWMDPDEVCGLAVALLSEGSGGRTGENIGVWCGFEIALTPSPQPKAGATRWARRTT
jgi:NAD(P)-dependent dehydrogenase (short-subunit alcohol dehydrogenase family)